MYRNWMEKAAYTDPFLAETLVKESLRDMLYQARDVRVAGATRSLRQVRPRLGGWLARQACRMLCGLGNGLMTLGQRLHQYGLMTTTPAGEQS